MDGRVQLRIVGYETANAQGYIRRLVGGNAGVGRDNAIKYIGEVPRAELLTQAARAHVGLALMPCRSNSLNMQHLTGASNKPFDYMAAGLALLVSDLPDWTRMFVEPGFARAANPTSANSVFAALEWFVNHSHERQEMAARGQAMIKSAWNYETVFAPILEALSNA
jgi:spore maturation protein CgeB